MSDRPDECPQPPDSDHGSDEYLDEEDPNDDEGTLDEEEAFEGDSEGELNALQEEQDVPLEDLMRMYGYGGEAGRSSNNANDVSSSDNQQLPTNESPDIEQPSTSDAPDSTVQLSSSKAHGYFSDSSGSENDDEYVPPEHWRKQIRVGEQYQVTVPECTGIGSPDIIENGLSAEQKEEQAAADSSPERDCLLWKPDDLNDTQVEEYLRSVYVDRPPLKKPRIQPPEEAAGPSADDKNSRNRVRDDEDALYLLFKCGYNLPEALSQLSELSKNENPTFVCPTSCKRTDTSDTKPWSEEECELFEQGLRLYGKCFTSIQRDQLPHRRAGELVQFYYLWKKTERHDMFVQRVRFEKRQFLLNPNTTDYMDHFISQMDAASGRVPLPSHVPDQPTEEPSSTSAYDVTSSTSLIASDPKHGGSRFHTTHFNEWGTVNEATVDLNVNEAAAASPSPVLPQLDTFTVDSILTRNA